jgi:HAD superfamily hydrolase (TIGR01549 family)
MPHDFDAWLVDLDGTLYRAIPVKRMMALELLTTGWTAITTLRRFRQQHEHLRRTLEYDTEDPFALQLQQTAEALGADLDWVSKTVDDWMIERPRKWIARFTRHDLVSRVVEFKASGGKVAIVSDYPARRKLEAVANLGNVDAVVASGEPGGPVRLKPHPDGFLKAANRLGVEPQRCLVIGDRADADGEAARRAGMSFELVN